MDRFSNEQIEEMFFALPIKLQEALTSGDVFEKTKSIASTTAFTDIETAVLIKEAGNVLMRLQTLDAFERNLNRKLGPNKARGIISAMKENVFASLDKHLKKPGSEAPRRVPESKTSQHSLTDHIKTYEERRRLQKKREAEERAKRATPPANLPTGTAVRSNEGSRDVASKIPEAQPSQSNPHAREEKHRPTGSDPYRESIE